MHFRLLPNTDLVIKERFEAIQKKNNRRYSAER